MNQQTISTLLVYLFPFVVALATYGYQHLAQRLPLAQRDTLNQFAQMSVQKTEQQCASASAPNKKALATETITDLFRAFGLPLPQSAAIDAAIESAVFVMSQTQAQAPQPGGTDQVPRSS